MKTSPASGQLDSHLSLKLTLDTYRRSTWPEQGQSLTVMSEDVTTGRTLLDRRRPFSFTKKFAAPQKRTLFESQA